MGLMPCFIVIQNMRGAVAMHPYTHDLKSEDSGDFQTAKFPCYELSISFEYDITNTN